MLDACRTFTLVVLAGGKSSRMGRDKYSLPWRNHTLLDDAVKKVIGAKEVLISSNTALSEYRCVPDVFPECGPMSGIHACLQAADTQKCLVLPVDVPQFPTKAALELVAFAYQAQALYCPLSYGGRIEPLIAVFDRGLLPILENKLKYGEYQVSELLHCVPTVAFPFQGSGDLIKGCNTPQEYAKLYDHWGRLK